MSAADPHADPTALAIARALLEGFDRHYRAFSETNRAAQQRFEQADWHGQQRAVRERIEFYDQRVGETAALLRAEFRDAGQPATIWPEVKRLYVGLLVEHRQPELAETFFNSVTTKILHRSYFHNDFIFVRPAVSTEYIELDEQAGPTTYRVYYPTRETWQATWMQLVRDFGLRLEFEDLARDAADVVAELRRRVGEHVPRANFQIQVLGSLFFRNKGAYVVGKIINGYQLTPVALPLLRTPAGQLVIDTVLHTEDDMQMLFSYARAYFMVDMPIPSAYVQFLRSLMPRKPRAEIYSAIGLQKQGKNSYYRDLLHHLRHSTDRFRIAPGIRGMVMLVFDLPSFPYVFKIIKDHFPKQKATTREQIKAKYLLVKRHDRVGRMADTLEYSKVALPLARFEPELVEEMRSHCASLLEFTENYGQRELIIDHVYIERRMIPLNLYLKEADAAGDTAAIDSAVLEYGNAIKDLVAANIFPGDMMWKNFGITRQGKVVFYDYDEIEYISDCTFRRVPPREEDNARAGDAVWFDVGPKDVFPETFGPFLLGNARVRQAFMTHHADLLDPAYWNRHKQRIQAGEMHDVYPYDVQRRFALQRLQAGAPGP
ncbi:MAG: bifunctional isocitrate dehydrogenase kinase/phosphatase protein [Pseudomonadota bacterium]